MCALYYISHLSLHAYRHIKYDRVVCVYAESSEKAWAKNNAVAAVTFCEQQKVRLVIKSAIMHQERAASVATRPKKKTSPWFCENTPALVMRFRRKNCWDKNRHW